MWPANCAARAIRAMPAKAAVSRWPMATGLCSATARWGRQIISRPPAVVKAKPGGASFAAPTGVKRQYAGRRLLAARLPAAARTVPETGWCSGWSAAGSKRFWGGGFFGIGTAANPVRKTYRDELHEMQFIE